MRTPPLPARYRRLNLGCGQFRRDDALNVDLSPLTSPDLIVDLDSFPYPFPTGWFELIEASHVLEHLAHPLSAMAELHRILRPGGRLHLRVPHFSRGFTHPDHKAGFDVSFPLHFDPGMPPWYSGTPFELETMRLRWNGQPYLKPYVASAPAVALARGMGAVIDAIANLAPMVTSRLLCFWVGGFEEIEFRFIAADRPGAAARAR